MLATRLFLGCGHAVSTQVHATDAKQKRLTLLPMEFQTAVCADPNA